MARQLSIFPGMFILLTGLPVAAICVAQETQPASPEELPQLPLIADEPRTIDPATLLPEQLTALATVDFSNSSLGEVVNWLQDSQKLVVLLNNSALSEIGVLPSEPISDHLHNGPVYLLLNRLRSLNLAWYFQDGIVHITSAEDAESRMTTRSYNLGDLLDSDYEQDKLVELIEQIVAPETWEAVGGVGALTFLGDVIFIRQTDAIQREIAGLLAALREHARQTFVLDPPQHLAMRDKLAARVSVDFLDTPLVAAVEQLAQQAAVDLRLDMPALRDVRIREREPITLQLTDHSLATVLQAITMNLKLSWVLRDGVLWITSPEDAASFQKIAVYDVRDLSRDEAESEALRDAVTTQTEPALWDDAGGPGSLVFVQPGTLVIRNQERVLMEVLDLLEAYRTALRGSKPRDRGKQDPQEVITVYYRMHAGVAESLQAALPAIVRPNSWKLGDPDQPGVILKVASPPDLSEHSGSLAGTSQDSADAEWLVTSRAVLIITQTREIHAEIAQVLRRVESGDQLPGEDAPGMGMGGMGGFGGGFFSVPSANKHARQPE